MEQLTDDEGFGVFLATIAVGVLALAVLVGCATKPTGTPPAPISCVAHATYSASEEAAVGNAIAALPPNSPLLKPLTDYTAILKSYPSCPT